MKAPAPDAQNIRIIDLFKRVILLPFTATAFLWRSVNRWVQWRKPSTQLRAEDQLRQSRARRTLRGLPPDHNQHSHAPE